MITIEEKYRIEVNALRDMAVDEYEGVIDSLIKELEEVGLFAKYEKILLEIDNAFDDDFEKQFDEGKSILKEIKQ
ncbi:MAG TPA: hypothetical protein EYG68_04305 [Leucothrix mucor]|nr:hypothetical protein [Leucothrix mucor]